MKHITVLLPNQLFKLTNPRGLTIWLAPKFFTEYKYHKNKLVLHYASIEYYKQTYKTSTIDSLQELKSYDKITIYDFTDHGLEKEIKSFCKKHNIELEILDSPLFLCTRNDLAEYMESTKKPYFNHTFYVWIRNKLNILMNGDKPIGGKYSYDVKNRESFKKTYKEPKIKVYSNKYIKKAIDIVEDEYADNYGEINTIVPVTHKDAEAHFKLFLKNKLKEFGPYEDAIREDVDIGYHANISALLNTGLLDINWVIKTTLAYASKHKTPIQSLEGFIRQLISWREYVRLCYIYEHKKFTSMNFFKHKNKMPKTWYTGNTGIQPLDTVINKVLRLGYAHHIERLMILCNFALIAKIEPKQVYKWFMTLVTIDAYEWVMEPNVYGMGLHSVGPLMMNRPYFSSANYLINMGVKKGDWVEIWNKLYRKFISDNSKYLSKIYAYASVAKRVNLHN